MYTLPDKINEPNRGWYPGPALTKTLAVKEQSIMASAKVNARLRTVKRFQEDIVWLTGKFNVDSDGRVWRSGKRAEHRVGGYLQVRVMIDGIRYYTCAHRLVWRALNGPIPVGMVINHKNGRKDDNRPSNLEVITYSANTAHAHRTGLLDQYGQKNPASKLSDNEVAQIRSMYAQGSYTMAAIGKIFGVRFQHVSRIVRGTRRPKQGGPTSNGDLRHSACERDSASGRFVGKKDAGRLLDGKEWSEFPEAPCSR